MARDKYLNLYFHPWEFTNLKQQRFGLPWYVTKRTGNEMIDTFEAFIVWAKKKKFRFGCLQDLVNKGHPVKARVQ